MKFINPLPLPLKITSLYGPRKPISTPMGLTSNMHYGIDFGAVEGTDIYAVEEGLVLISGNTGDKYGCKIILQHENGYKSFYAHLSKVLISSGERVSRGQVIGKVGKSGAATGPHLHFGIMNGGTYDDPQKYLPGEDEELESVTVKRGQKTYLAYRIEGKVFVELRAFAEAEGSKIDWDETAKMAQVWEGPFFILEQIKNIMKGV